MAALLCLTFLTGCREDAKPLGPLGPSISGTGDLVATVRGNDGDHMSGIVQLVHASTLGNAAFARDETGINFEHIISGVSGAPNSFTPRAGPFDPTVEPDGSITLTRLAADEYWRVGSTLSFHAAPPHAIDFEFRATVEDASLFGPGRVAMFFFASYMRGVLDPELHFRGIPAPEASEDWVSSRAHLFPADSYVPLGSLGFATQPGDSALAASVESEAWPRIARPFFYGRASGGMVYALMFDRLSTPDDELRFAVMRWRLAEGDPDPAWDFGYVARNLADGARVGFRGRLVWKPFVSGDDILAEYEAWQAQLPAATWSATARAPTKP